MDSLNHLRPTPALIVAMTALVLALSGGAIAAKDKIQTADIAKGAVTTNKIADGAVTSRQIAGKTIKGNRIKDGGVKAEQIADGTITGAKIADGAISGAKLADGGISGAKLADGTITGAKVADGTITGAKVADDTLDDENMSDYEVIGDNALIRVTATDGATAAAARVAAPEIPLYQKGQLRIYGKCFRATGTDELFGVMYIATSAPGAILDSSPGDALQGGPTAADFLNPNTLEEDRELADETVTGTDTEFRLADDDAWRAFAPDGTSLAGVPSLAVKNGNLPGGNGVYGAGNVCLFGGAITG